ncbi:odorant receptor 131-2-like [Esox lucius]|uniref:odorant receptor 131-2-like n=1 Tax=Esox lucius TaxID=8010 RepID=UPI0014768C5B|nr:odorant receptor 131-2-like [Esox lucius]
MSGPLGLAVVHMQSIRLVITEERIFKMFLVLGTHLLFLNINLAMMFTLWMKPSFRNTTRYILFAHMLFNDSLHLAMGMLLYTLGALYVLVVRVACAFMVLLSSSTFTNAPLNLAVMSLERYTAICFPLRHSELATTGRTRQAVVLVWALGIVNVLIDVCALFLAGPSFFLSPAVCTLEQLHTAGWQQEKGTALNTLLFVAVAAVLIYTYVAIVMEARSASSSDPRSARRALHTVLLHVLQLGLCLMSFLYVELEALLAKLPPAVFVQLRFVNFFVVLILPRCLSSIIYGLRDEAFRAALWQHFTCRSVRRVGLSTKN